MTCESAGGDSGNCALTAARRVGWCRRSRRGRPSRALAVPTAEDLGPGGVKQHVAIADPPDPEGSLRISAAVTGELPDQALSVVFAVRPDEQVPAAPAYPPSLGGKIPGQRYHIAV